MGSEDQVVFSRMDGDVVYRLKGAFTDSKESYGLLEKVREDVAGGVPRVVLDLTNVPHLTSGGIGITCACYTSLLNAERRFALVGVDERSRMMFTAVGLWDRLEHFETLDEATRA